MRRTTGILWLARVIDLVLVPFTAVSAVWMLVVRKLGVRHLPATWWTLRKVGVFPVRDHYYEPLINPTLLKRPLSEARSLPGIDFNIEEQLSILRSFHFQDELAAYPIEKTSELQYYFNNGSFLSGDAEYLYSLIRYVRPKRMVEIGCGFSTLISQAAIKKNASEDPSYSCEHVCIEPYEQPWLERLGIRVLRSRVEDCGPDLFCELSAGDILFIDSSHVIRPQGDVLCEFLQVLPILQSGVYVHVHDVFTPRDYLKEWIVEDVKLWNEQYLLEAFLSHNSSFRVVGALNFLKHEHPELVRDRFPMLRSEYARREPGSFWMVKN